MPDNGGLEASSLVSPFLCVFVVRLAVSLGSPTEFVHSSHPIDVRCNFLPPLHSPALPHNLSQCGVHPVRVLAAHVGVLTGAVTGGGWC